jgi:tetratricopeptide (TPR) repeat protein
MKKLLCLFAMLVPLAPFGSGSGLPEPASNHDLAALLANLDLEASTREADSALARNPANSLALFVRMEAAELEARTDVVLDSALRLCNESLPNPILKIASGRILEYAGNTQAFDAVLKRIKAAAAQQSTCSSDLALGLVTAAADGDRNLNLEQAAAAAGVLTRWQIAGPFGHYSNAGFDQKWPPETDRLSHGSYGKPQVEKFLFRDGVVSLPDYLSSSGVYYASSEIESAFTGNAILELSSPGPYAVFVDGRLVLTHDSRFAWLASSGSVELSLNSGKHHVVVKFTPDAVPFRVMLHRQAKSKAADALQAGPLNNYLEGLAAYFRDDLPSLQRIAAADWPRAMKYLQALLFSELEEHSVDAVKAWEALLPASLARIKLAESKSGDHSRNIAQELPDSEAAQEAEFQMTGNQDALQRLVALHPSCSHLMRARKFLSSLGQLEEARKFEQRLAGCAPDSLDYAKALSENGNHKEAGEQLLKLLTMNPLDRAARLMVIRELLLDGQEKEAAEQAKQLQQIAPNSPAYAEIAAAPDQALDSSSGRAAGFVQQNQFYAPYRRSGLEIVQRSANRRFSGGPSVTLLSDKVVSIQNDGSISIYVHRITRLLNKDGIARLGEVYIPRSADLLELRTIKTDANGKLLIVEPELVQQKSTISMPALESGDSIEEEFVLHYTDWDEAPDDTAGFTFGSFTAPILYSRFVAITPEMLPIKIFQENGARDARLEHGNGNIVRTWENNDIAQTAPENNLPLDNQLPLVAIARVDKTNARLRDDLISATRIGPEVTSFAQSLQLTNATDFDKAQQLYRFVSTRIQSANAEWSANNAEDTLLNFQGSRTAVLLALSRALGLKSELVMARKVGQGCPRNKERACYTVPLVRFTFSSGRTVDADAESAGVPFGALPFDVDSEDAVLAPLRASDAQQVHVRLMPSTSDEKSVAEGELFLNESGSLTVDLHVKLGLARSQQVRAVLQASNQSERRIFFDQLAARIFSGATQVSGASTYLDDPERPLELTLQCQVPQIVAANGPWKLDQLVPALGLRELYAKTTARRFPLYVDSVLFESTTFHLHLPPGFQVRSLPPDFSAHNHFGEYSVEFRSNAQEITIQREFHIPAQIIPGENYQLFLDFAGQIEQAERGRIGLDPTSGTAAKLVSGRSKFAGQ